MHNCYENTVVKNQKFTGKKEMTTFLTNDEVGKIIPKDSHVQESMQNTTTLQHHIIETFFFCAYHLVTALVPIKQPLFVVFVHLFTFYIIIVLHQAKNLLRAVSIRALENAFANETYARPNPNNSVKRCLICEVLRGSLTSLHWSVNGLWVAVSHRGQTAHY